ncbi:uncharacterized protein LOC120645048 isoform X1 [Panicum virgatum]|uniref:uncharacterized protein LOC120645048 isoform X1 n=1 Tax=Panicum virgatum TaxID=38727 RepID=UPI0019D66446|nr:uncharacterized protein LOC120645048 isoform X1 [Panicum virgatum]
MLPAGSAASRPAGARSPRLPSCRNGAAWSAASAGPLPEGQRLRSLQCLPPCRPQSNWLPTKVKDANVNSVMKLVFFVYPGTPKQSAVLGLLLLDKGKQRLLGFRLGMQLKAEKDAKFELVLETWLRLKLLFGILPDFVLD